MGQKAKQRQETCHAASPLAAFSDPDRRPRKHQGLVCGRARHEGRAGSGLQVPGRLALSRRHRRAAPHPWRRQGFGEPGQISRPGITATTGSGVVDHVAFRATGLLDMIDHLKKKGVDFKERRVSNQGLYQLFLIDPNGVKIELDFEAAEAKGREQNI